MSEATAIKITIWPGVTSAVVNLRELQTTIFSKVIAMEILVLTEHLLTQRNKERIIMAVSFSWVKLIQRLLFHLPNITNTHLIFGDF